jgi:hypothetical protein
VNRTPDPLDFIAFRELVHTPYLRYARLRLGEPQLAGAAVEAAFADIRRAWPQTLSSASVPQAAWRRLRQAIADRARGGRGGWSGDRGECGDAALLHRSLGLTLEDTAGLLGVPVPCVWALLVRADRESARHIL